MDELAKRLRTAREQAGLSQGQAAKLLDLHRPTVSEIEAGRRKVKAIELNAFAEIYGVTTEWLLSKTSLKQERMELVARELSSLKQEDLDRIYEYISSIRKLDDESKE